MMSTELVPCEIELDEGVPCPNETDERCCRCQKVVCWSHKVYAFNPLYDSSSVEDECLCPECAAGVIEELAAEVGDIRDWLRLRNQQVVTPKTYLRHKRKKA